MQQIVIMHRDTAEFVEKGEIQLFSAVMLIKGISP